MDSARFDRLTRELAGRASRRGLAGGVLGIAAGLVGNRATAAACPPGQVSSRGRCLCKRTGRPPVGEACLCPLGQTDTGDGLGCLACRDNGDCPPTGDPELVAICATNVCATCVPITAPFSPAIGTCTADAECCDGGSCCNPGVGSSCRDLSTDRSFCGASCATAINCSNFTEVRVCIDGQCVVP